VQPNDLTLRAKGYTHRGAKAAIRLAEFALLRHRRPPGNRQIAEPVYRYATDGDVTLTVKSTNPPPTLPGMKMFAIFPKPA